MFWTLGKNEHQKACLHRESFITMLVSEHAQEEILAGN